MASIQEQLKHIRTTNDDWYDEHRRILGELAELSRRATPNPPSQSTTPQPEKANGSSSSSDEQGIEEGSS
ncbi:uncharacterized protein BO66DRAFT_388930 [Aspergillus aculeatinus CBS 121060]|nr:hypothetical protein BO66DRAFT_388930 [Aspergillus aculeatinus CBS 121060]RAH73335.1 hypothetical protein BO66DRAFT_388930 [Aspergillus aculeatinus CBS 121060]